ncbi:uncharacterized protein DFL_003331 [Arthrobotrys flagrans]|uniref:Uncharacterized protein n=1 Tax=Arthrobotrys flagrans TaxID=97331 RepID=A0A437A1J2_ARTFL|nr:hypothetical protein DFL_003331 [Arthrobotrys flagrans]
MSSPAEKSHHCIASHLWSLYRCLLANPIVSKERARWKKRLAGLPCGYRDKPLRPSRATITTASFVLLTVLGLGLIEGTGVRLGEYTGRTSRGKRHRRRCSFRVI